MSSGGGSDSSVYAAAQGREYIRDELDGKPNHFIREFAGLIQDEQTLDLLNYFAALWADEPEDFVDTRLAREIIQSSATKMADRAFAEGNSSMLQGMVGLTDHSGDGEDLLNAVARRLMNEGAIGLVLGPPGAGKTALTVDIARVWAALTGGTIIGNTSWEGFDKEVKSDVQLLETMGHTEGKVLAVIDETAQELSGFGSGNKAAEVFSDQLTFVRKREEDHGPHPKKGSVLMVNHTRTKTAKPFRDLCTFAVEKPSRSDPGRARLLDSEGGKDNFTEEFSVKGITDTRENYAEHEASDFEILAGEDDDDQEGDGGTDVARQKSIAAALRAVKPWSDEKGVNYEDSGAIAGYSAAWVSDRVSEWRDGEHRELLNRDD